MYIGIDIGGTNIKGALTNRFGNIISFKKISTGFTSNEIENGICALVENLALAKSISTAKIKAIGIGAAGAIDNKNGIILTSANIQSWKRHPLAKNIEKRIKIKTFLENDANVAVIGEWWKGNGQNYKNWIMLTLGTGIGGGAVINNKIYTGRKGSAMEFGHTSIDYRGKKCVCGNRGCLELYASATALVKLTKSKLKHYTHSTIHKRVRDEKLTSKIVYEEALNGDILSKNVFNEVSTYLGFGVSNLVSIFNPEAIIIAGGLSRANKLIYPVVKNVIKERVQQGLKENIKYLTIKNEERIPALGAAKVAIEAFSNENKT